MTPSLANRERQASRVERFANRLYRFALRALPAELRDVYGEEMQSLFASEFATAYERTTGRAVATLTRALVDVAVRAPREHHRERNRVNNRVTTAHLRKESPMQSFLADLRFAQRALRRTPAFTFAAVLALGLGIGCAAGVFGLLDGVVLKPLPYKQPDRLVTLWEVNQDKGLMHEPISPVNFVDFRNLKSAFSEAAAWWRPQINLTNEANSDPIRVAAIETSTNLFAVLGVRPQAGRLFESDSIFRVKAPEVIISDRLWRSRFGGTAATIGSSIRLNGSLYSIVGVMPSGFNFPGETDLWQGLEWNLSQHSRNAHFMESVARLKPGVSVEQANRELLALGGRLANDFSATNKSWRARSISLEREIVGPFRAALFALVAASSLLLVIACINVANLLLARTTARQREVAVRAAIGASRARLARLFLTESLVLTVLGSVLGLAVAVASVKGLLAWSPIKIPRADEVGMSVGVFAFAIGIAAITTLTFGLIPALLMSRSDLQSSLREGSKGSGGHARIRGALVVSEVALAVMLLSGSGMLIRSVAHLLSESTGVNPTGLIAADIQLSEVAYKDWGRVARFYTELRQGLSTHPEIASAGVSNFLPLEPAWRVSYSVLGEAPAAPDAAVTAQVQSVDDGYFSALRVPLVNGRAFTARDDSASIPVVVVNETFARKHWPGQNPVGRHLILGVRGMGPLSRRIVAGNDHEIVGVVRDIKNTSLRSAAEPAIFFSGRQFPSRRSHLVLRGTADPARLAAIAREELHKLDAAIPPAEFKTMERVLAESVDPPRFVMFLMSAFAVLALTLAAVGIYGVLTYSVTQRQKEIGIRVALGALPSAMLRMIVRQGLALTLLGCAIGVGGAYVAGQSLASFLYGVTAFDPITLSAVVGLVTLVALGACLIPGRRAAGQDPVRALRGD